MKRVHFAVLAFALLAVGACTQRNDTKPASNAPPLPPRQTFREIVDTINARVPSMTMVAGVYKAGNQTSDYRAYYDGGTLQFLHEHLDMGNLGSSVNRYYFDGGKLLYAEEDKLSRGISEGGNAQTRAIVEWMVFDSTGTVIQAEKQVDGKPRAPDEEESKELVRHVDEVAKDAAAHKEDTRTAGSPGGGYE